MAEWNGAVASREQQREAKRFAVVKAAAKCFNRSGYHATTLEEVAAILGVTKPAIYYYFRNKEALLYECLLVSHQCGLDAMREADEMGGPALARLEHLFRSFCQYLLQRGGAYAPRVALDALPPEQRSELVGNRRMFDAYSRQLIGEAIAEKAIRPLNVRLASNFFLGAVNWSLRWYSEDGEASPEEIANTFIDIYFKGVLQPT